MVAVLGEATQTAQAAFHTRRRPERETAGPRLAATFRALFPTFDPMPWQQAFFDIVGERLTPAECRAMGVPQGTPAYREIILSVPRRAAKTTSSFALLVDQCIRADVAAGHTPKSGYGAQTGTDTRRMFTLEFCPRLEGPNASTLIKKRVSKIYKGMGGEGVVFSSGSRLALLGNTSTSDHGSQFDTVVLDECFSDTDSTREGNISPGQLTLPMAQRVLTSTAGTAESVWWASRCAAGRKAVERDSGTGTAFIEYALPDGADIRDADMWPLFHPALGYSVTAAALKFAIDTMCEGEEGVSEAMRAYGNIPTARRHSSVIPDAGWERVTEKGATAKGAGPHVWAFDVAEDRSAAAIAVHNTATGVTAMTDYQPGTGWLTERMAERLLEHPGAVVYDLKGPAANLADPKWQGLGPAEMTQSFADFFDACTDPESNLIIRQDDRLDAAVAAAEIRVSSDSKRWSRSSSKIDISPLIAVNLCSVSAPLNVSRVKPFIL